MNALARICTIVVLGGVLLIGSVMLNPMAQDLAAYDQVAVNAQDAFEALDRFMRSAPDGLNPFSPG